MNPNNPSMKRANQSSDDTLVLIGIGFVLFLAAIFLFQHYHVLIFAWWKTVMLPIVKCIAWISSSFIGNGINLLINTTNSQAHALVGFLQSIPADQISWHGFYVVNNFIGKYILLVFLPVGIYITLSTFRSTQAMSPPYRNFKNSTALKNYMLARYYKKLSEEISNSKLYAGALATGLSAHHYCEKQGIVTLEDNGNTIDAFDQEKAYNTLITQLGPRFKAIDTLVTSEIGWIFTELMHFIPREFHEDIKYYVSESFQYNTTIFIALFSIAKRFGVVPLKSFLKLRYQNRSLWYAVLSVGGNVVMVEGIAIIAQYQHEHAIAHYNYTHPNDIKYAKTICIDSALEGLKQSIKDDPYERPWQSQNAAWQKVLEVGLP